VNDLQIVLIIAASILAFAGYLTMCERVRG